MKGRKNLERMYKKIMEKLKDEKIKLDISKDEDLSFAIMNLISIEEHLFMSGAKTGNIKYYEILKEVRELRKNLMKEIVKNYEEGAEAWCISKHLLAATMRLNEVGTKLLTSENKEKAYEYFGKAYTTYTLFWALNLGMFNLKEVKKEIDMDEEIKNIIEKEKEKEEKVKEESGKEEKISGIKKIIKKIIDCCIE
ncbi:MAG: hypothetical protein QXT34_03040 [Candidatus Aenigmatarchaeota archaeon]